MNTKFAQRRARALTFMLSLGMLAGVLIWAKLRLVTDIPRSALADPKQVQDRPAGHGFNTDQESQSSEIADELGVFEQGSSGQDSSVTQTQD